MGQNRPSKASGRPGGDVDRGTSGQAQHMEPAQKKCKPIRQKAPNALKGVESSLESAKHAGNDSGPKQITGPLSKQEPATSMAKGYGGKAKKGSSDGVQRPARAGTGPSLEPGTPLLPTRTGRPQGTGTPTHIQASTETASAEMEALSSAAAAFEAQKQSLRQSRTPSAEMQRPKQRGSAATPNGKVQADDLLKMVVGAALTGQQPEALRGRSTQDLQNHLMGSFFAGPGFQLPPTPEALPLPSSSLLQRLRQQ